MTCLIVLQLISSLRRKARWWAINYVRIYMIGIFLREQVSDALVLHIEVL